jgi:hypothetical protein
MHIKKNLSKIHWLPVLVKKMEKLIQILKAGWTLRNLPKKKLWGDLQQRERGLDWREVDAGFLVILRMTREV